MMPYSPPPRYGEAACARCGKPTGAPLTSNERQLCIGCLIRRKPADDAPPPYDRTDRDKPQGGCEMSEDSIVPTDRYAALGMEHPDPATMCPGQCEGTGLIPVTVNDEDDELRRRWHEAEAKSPYTNADPFRLVVCPACEGTGEVQP